MEIPAALLVVDNGSTDATADVVRGWSGPVPVTLLSCPRRGKGAAVRCGLLATTAPYVGFCDADLATDPDALDEVMRLLLDGHPVVVGSRRHALSIVSANPHRLRRHGAVLFNRLARGPTGGLTDTQCGFKFFSGRLARELAADLRVTGFAFDVELLVRCLRRGASIRDLPVIWSDVPGSRFSVWRHSLSCLRDLLWIRFLVGRAPRPGPVIAGRWEHPPAAGAEQRAWKLAVADDAQGTAPPIR